MKYVAQHGGNPRNLVLEGQEANYGTLGMCKMNMVLHGVLDFKIEYGDTLSNPKLVEGAPIQLESFYENRNIPIDQGGIKSLIPGSDAYSHLHQTNVKSYAIAGSYRPNANKSHESQESFYKIVVDPGHFNLDKDAFDDDNDLVVSVISQLGGLPRQIRQPSNNDIPNHSALYCNTVHDCFYINLKDEGISSETNSPDIQKDVTKLLSSSDNNKFAEAIGMGPPSRPSK